MKTTPLILTVVFEQRLFKFKYRQRIIKSQSSFSQRASKFNNKDKASSKSCRFEWSRTHIKDPIVRVRVRWITETRKTLHTGDKKPWVALLAFPRESSPHSSCIALGQERLSNLIESKDNASSKSSLGVPVVEWLSLYTELGLRETDCTKVSFRLWVQSRPMLGLNRLEAPGFSVTSMFLEIRSECALLATNEQWTRAISYKMDIECALLATNGHWMRAFGYKWTLNARFYYKWTLNARYRLQMDIECAL